MNVFLKLTLSFFLTFLFAHIVFAQESVPFELPSYSYDELYERNVQLSNLQGELEKISENISKIEKSRKPKSFKLLFFEVPCCGKEPLSVNQVAKKNEFIADRYSTAQKFENQLSDYREALRTLLSPDELKSIYSRQDDGTDYFNLVPSDNSLRELEENKELTLQKTLTLPKEDKLENVSYLYFKPVSFPTGVTLSIKSEPSGKLLNYTGDQLAKIDGEVGPVVGDNIDIMLVYSEGTDKTDLLYISDILVHWEGARKIELSPKFGPEQAAFGAETSGFECGGEDERISVESNKYPFIGRLAYNNDAFCTAFFLQDDLVATAGHCISTIKLGNSRFNKSRPKDDFSKVHFETHVKASAWQDGSTKISDSEHIFKIMKGSMKCSSCPDIPTAFPTVPDWKDANKFPLGKDWAIFKIRPEGTSFTLDEYKAKYNINDLELVDFVSKPKASYTGEIVGHGIDNEFTKNRAMQMDSGQITIQSAEISPSGSSILTYGIHTRLGSSGSPVLSLDSGDEGKLLGIHTHGFCEATAIGKRPKNAATLIDRSNF